MALIEIHELPEPILSYYNCNKERIALATRREGADDSESYKVRVAGSDNAYEHWRFDGKEWHYEVKYT